MLTICSMTHRAVRIRRDVQLRSGNRFPRAAVQWSMRAWCALPGLRTTSVLAPARCLV